MELLEQLSNAAGVSSDEGDVRKLIVEAIAPHVDGWRIDTMGNVFATRRATVENAPRVMLTAHMDEVGLMITRLQENGHLKVKAIGGLDPRILLGKAVLVGPDKVPGVIGMKPIHLLSGSERSKVGKIESMYIDIGATGKSNGKVSAGDFAIFATQYAPCGEGGRVKGKAFDNRVGCAIVAELLKQQYPVEVVGVFTVQEEIGARGAQIAAYAAEPDIALVVECTAANDLPNPDKTPEDDPFDGFPRLGDGPAITVMDRSMLADRQLVDRLIELAQSNDLPYQFKQPGIGGTDGGAIHTTREGVRSVVVSVPARYIHAPAAIIDTADYQNTVKLLDAALRTGVGSRE